MKRYQKQLSFILILAILLTVFTAAPFKVSAARTNYLVIYQPVDEQGDSIGNIQKEIYEDVDWGSVGFEGGTRIMLSVHAEDGYEFVGWDVRVQNGAAIEVHQESYYYYFDIPEGPNSGIRRIEIKANIELYDPNRPFTATIEPNHGESGNTVTLDGDTLVSHKDSQFADDVHPNDAGHKEYAENLIKELDKYIAQ